MAKCIVCGRSCKKGEEFCGMCAPIYGKRAVPGGDFNSSGNGSNGFNNGYSNGDSYGGYPGGYGEPERNSGKGKTVIIVILVITILALLAGVGAIVIFSVLGHKTSGSSGGSQPVTMSPIETPSAETSAEAAAGTDLDIEALVKDIDNRYLAQIKSYRKEDVITASEDIYALTFLNKVLVEIDVDSAKTADGRTKEYYFDKYYLYYVNMTDRHGRTSKLYYENDQLIRWVDEDGKNHDLGTSLMKGEEHDGELREAYNALNNYYNIDLSKYQETEPESTAAPTTEAPTTEAPTTAAPTTAAPTTAAPTTAASGGDFVFADSDTRLLKREELTSLSQERLRTALNEICARRGRKFTTSKWQNYFKQFSWYKPTIEASTFDDNMKSYLNDVEYQNIQLISKIEKEKGWR